MFIEAKIKVTKSMILPQKFKDRITIWSGIFLGIYPRKLKAESQRGIFRPKFTAALFMITKGHKQMNG